MTLERWIRLFAGSFILISLALAHWVNINWLWFTAFVGVNLFQVLTNRMVSYGGYSGEVGRRKN